MLDEIRQAVRRLHSGPSMAAMAAWIRRKIAWRGDHPPRHRASELSRLIAWGGRPIRLAAAVGGPGSSAREFLREAGLAGLSEASLCSLSRGPADGSRAALAHDGPVAELLRAAAAHAVPFDLMILAGYKGFEEFLDELAAAPAVDPLRSPMPDLAVVGGDCQIFGRAWWHDRLAYEGLLGTTTACVGSDVVYFSAQNHPRQGAAEFAPGSLVAAAENGHLRFLVNGFFGANARTASTINLFRSLLAEPSNSAGVLRRLPPRWFAVIQHGDFALHEAPSVAYGKRRGSAAAVKLMPDAFFLESGGYRQLRDAAASRALPHWQDREDRVFWRGSATYSGTSPSGEAIAELAQVPRVALCLALRGRPDADVAISNPWGLQFSHEQAIEQLTAAEVYRPPIPMLQHAVFRYLIDIDGVANAWSFFEKLLLGACILKVGSPFEQWFYPEIEEWVHFVPVRDDLRDLIEKIDWCRAHPDRSREIAAAGQHFALQHTYEIGREIARRAIRDCVIRV